jgi:hypothetical protein
MKRLTALAGTLAIVFAGAAAADATADKLNELAKTKLSGAFKDPIVIDAIKAQNAKHASLAEGDIDKLDKQWRAEAKSGAGPLVDSVLANALSKHLMGFKQAGQGLYTEVFVMDSKGLNVGQSDVTSDYWQGDEAKFQKTFPAGPRAVFVDKVEFDESSQSYQSQISMTVVDPATNEPLGAVTVGVSVDNLK